MLPLEAGQAASNTGAIVEQRLGPLTLPPQGQEPSLASLNQQLQQLVSGVLGPPGQQHFHLEYTW